MIILDTDFASVLAKAEIIGLIKRLFSGKHDIIITPKVYEELKVPKEYGYTYPEDIFKNLEKMECAIKTEQMSLLNFIPAECSAD